MSKLPPEEKIRKKPDHFSILPKIINGGIAGIVGVCVVFPLDLVKTRLQNQTIGPKGEKQYKNIFDCFKKTIKSEGYLGMYRGSGVNILLVTPEKAVKLAANDTCRYYFTNPDGTLPIYRQMIAGGIAGAFQVLITTPMELLKIQMQDAGRVQAQAKADRKSFHRVTAWELVKRFTADRGFFGLYRGIRPTLVRDIIFSLVYFPLFAAFNDLGIDEKHETAPFWVSFLGGLASGMISAFIVTPADVVKTRLQTVTKGKGERQYTGVMHCITETMKHEGPTAFFKGALCRIIVLAPLYGIVQTVYYLGIAEAILGYK